VMRALCLNQVGGSNCRKSTQAPILYTSTERKSAKGQRRSSHAVLKHTRKEMVPPPPDVFAGALKSGYHIHREKKISVAFLGGESPAHKVKQVAITGPRTAGAVMDSWSNARNMMIMSSSG
jgi:hypothetical protein